MKKEYVNQTSSKIFDYSFAEVVRVFDQADTSRLFGIEGCTVTRVKWSDHMYDLIGSVDKIGNQYIPIMMYIAQQVCTAYGLNVEPCTLGLYNGAFVAVYSVPTAMHISLKGLQESDPQYVESSEFSKVMEYIQELRDFYGVPQVIDTFLESFVVDALTGFSHRNKVGFNFGLRRYKGSLRVVSINPIRASVSDLDSLLGTYVLSESSNNKMSVPSESLIPGQDSDVSVLEEYSLWMKPVTTRGDKLRKRQAENMLEVRATIQNTCGYLFNGRPAMHAQFIIRNEYRYVRTLVNKIYRMGLSPVNDVFDNIDVLPTRVKEICKNLYLIRINRLRYCVEYLRVHKYDSDSGTIEGSIENADDLSSDLVGAVVGDKGTIEPSDDLSIPDNTDTDSVDPLKYVTTMFD